MAQSSPDVLAEAHIRRGLELRRVGDDVAALAEFEQAQRLAPSPRVRAQIGLALQALGRWRDAEEVQLQVLAETPDPWVREHADLLRESLTTAQHHLGWLSVECNVAGARLLVNGDSIGTLPLLNPVRVIAGAVVVQVRADGYEPILRTILVPAGMRARESVTLVLSIPEPTGGATAVGRSDATRRALGWSSIAVGGGLVAGVVVAAVVSAVHSAAFNDDSRCFVGPLTRDQRCGVDRGIFETSLVTAIVAFAAGGVALGAGVVLIATSPPKATGLPRSTIACGTGLLSFGCTGHF